MTWYHRWHNLVCPWSSWEHTPTANSAWWPVSMGTSPGSFAKAIWHLLLLSTAVNISHISFLSLQHTWCNSGGGKYKQNWDQLYCKDKNFLGWEKSQQSVIKPTLPSGSWAAVTSADFSLGADEQGCGFQRPESPGSPVLQMKEGGDILSMSPLSHFTRQN